LWLTLAGPIYGAGLYLGLPSGIPHDPHVWTGSAHHAIDLVLRPLISSGALQAAPIWALATVVLPWLVRGRSLPLQLVLVTVWAAVVVSATQTAIGMLHSSGGSPGSGTAAVGAVASACVALAPSALAHARVARARGRFP
jgi:hypothetical protein